jgi:hypothetical protein
MNIYRTVLRSHTHIIHIQLYYIYMKMIFSAHDDCKWMTECLAIDYILNNNKKPQHTHTHTHNNTDF